MDQRTFCNHERARNQRPEGSRFRLGLFERALLTRCACLRWPCVGRRLPRTAPDAVGPSASRPKQATILGEFARWVIPGSRPSAMLSGRALHWAPNRSAHLSTSQSDSPRGAGHDITRINITKINRLSFGDSLRPARPKASTSGCNRYSIGLRSMFGATSSGSRFQFRKCISRRTENGFVPSAVARSRIRSQATPKTST